jgi:endo-1,4-beta-D-glucanase Y
MKNIRFILSIFLVTAFSIQAWSQHQAFPMHTQYTENHIKPSNYTQDELDNQTIAFYEKWKNSYLINGCENNQYYVFFDSGNTLTVSEAMGYGMLITPLMAGYDPQAKTYFDGLYRFYKAHPSHINNRLMAWKQITGCVDADGPDSATDGDIDIAFGLLLAHAQWGSWGAINYFQEAVEMINAIMEDDVHNEYFSVKLGDWVSSGGYARGTRTSDFIFDHFKVFQCATLDSNWTKVIDTTYYFANQMLENYSQETGLLPDFIEDVNTSPRPADPNFLEGNNDGNYSYNACRDPWRLGTDYLINGDARALNITKKINQWLWENTGGQVNRVKSGYKLDGSYTANWQDLSFMAPFTVGAMTDTTHQEWLNDLYDKTLSMSFSGGGYYGNSLKLLSMIVISGNYWVPGCDIMNAVGQVTQANKKIFSLYPSQTSDFVHITFYHSAQQGKYQLKIFDTNGHIINQSQIPSNDFEINTSDFDSGIYIIKLSDEEDTSLQQTEKMIIIH